MVQFQKGKHAKIARSL